MSARRPSSWSADPRVRRLPTRERARVGTRDPPARRHDRHMEDEAPASTGVDWREVVVVVLLSVTTILTAWVGFQSSKWGGAMSISFSQASTQRIEATRYEGVANRKLS